MKKWFEKINMAYNAPVLVCLLVLIILVVIPTGYEDKLLYQDCERVAARVVSVDNSNIVDTGLVRSGEQKCTVTVLDGLFKGQNISAVNMLNGSLEQDKIFVPGDKALLVISHQGDKVTAATMTDHFRLEGELLMAVCFIALLVLFAGKTGIRALLSFGLTVLCLWKILIPAYLAGLNPIWVGLGITLFLTLLIIALVYGFDKRCMAAVSGSFLGILVTCVMGILFTDLFKIHGAVMAYSESLLYSGYQGLNLTRIFMASIFIGASGAIMDLSVDITSSVHEVVQKRPDLGWKAAVESGMNVGRSAMGTMTTTLLFAYSGSCVALLMVFMAQGTPLDNIFNYKYVAAELIHTVIGSFGLVTVAPFTALCAGVLLTRTRGNKERTEEGSKQAVL